MPESESSYSNVGSILILLGGILAIVASAIRIIFVLFIGRPFWAGIARPMLGRISSPSAIAFAGMARWVYGFMIIGAALTVALGIIAIYVYMRVKNSKVQSGGLIAIVTGIIMLVSTHWLAGILTLVGGILCYTWREAEPSASSPTPS